MRALFFISIGVLFATVGEFHLNILMQPNVLAYFKTFIWYPVFMVVAYLVHKLLRSGRVTNLVYYLLFGIIGLAIEWLLLGNSPSGNPAAIQWGMFAFWTVVICAPRAWHHNLSGFRNLAIWFAAYAVLSIVVGFSLPPEGRLFFMAWIMALGYAAASVHLLILFWRVNDS